MGEEFITNEVLSEVETTTPSIDAKKQFNRVGWGLAIMSAIVLLVQSILLIVIKEVAPEIRNTSWVVWGMTAVGFYLTAFPIYCIYMKKIPSAPKGETHNLSIGNLVHYFFMSYAVMILTNYVTILIALIIAAIKGSPLTNPIGEAVTSSNVFFTFIFAGIAAPIFEEIVFRKILLDKLRYFGDKTAIWITALAFGLFHMNLSQFFYAVALGLIFAYIVLRTNQIKYTIILHMCINIMGSVIAPGIVGTKNLDLIRLFGMVVLIILIIGIVSLIRSKKNAVWEEGVCFIHKSMRMKTIYANPGMIAYFIICMALIVITTIS